MADFLFRVRGTGDFSQLSREVQTLLKSTEAQLSVFGRRAVAQGSGAGVAAPVAATRREFLGHIRRETTAAVSAGTMTAAEAAQVRRAGRQMFNEFRQQLVAAVAAGPQPAPLPPPKIARIVRREARDAPKDRELGLHVGLAKEAALEAFSDRDTPQRTRLSQVRKRRETRENQDYLISALADDEEKAQRAVNSTLRRRLRIDERRLARAATTAADLDEEARDLAASRARSRILSARADKINQQPLSFLGAFRQKLQPDAGGQQTTGQFLGSKALISGGFGLTGAALYGAVRLITDMVKQAETLQRTFKTIESQFEAIGKADQFRGFRKSVLDIARETGVAGDEVAKVAFQLRGVYEPTRKAVEETTGAIKVGVVTGIAQAELTDSLTAAALSYGTTIESIGDKAVGLEERFGVLARESLKVFGDMASSAKEAGLSLDELGAIVAVIQQASGRSGTAIGEGLGRVLPAIGESAAGIVRLYRLIPELTPNLNDVTSGLKEGRTGDVLLQLVRDYESLDKATQQYVVTLLGGRREAQLLNPLFANSAKILKEVGRSESDAGKVAQRFNDIQETLTNTMARLREEVLQLGDSLARAGLLDAFLLIAGAAGGMIQFLGAALRMFAYLSDSLGGVPGKLLGVATGVIAVKVALEQLAKARAFLGGINALVAESRGGAAAAAAAPSATRTAAQSAAHLAGGLVGRGGPLSTIGGRTLTGGLGAIASLGTLTILAADTVLIQKAIEARETAGKKVKSGLDFVQSAAEGLTLNELVRKRKAGEFAGDFIPSQGRFGFGHRVASFITGQTTAETIADRTIAQKTAAEYAAAVKLRFVRGAGRPTLPDGSEDLRETAGKKFAERLETAEGKGEAGADARKILNRLSAKDRLAVQRAVDKQKAIADTVATEGTKQLKSVEDMEAAFQAGEVSFAELASVYDQELKALRDSDGGPGSPIHEKVIALQRKINQAVAENLAASSSFVANLLALQGATAADTLGSVAPIIEANLNQLKPVSAAYQADFAGQRGANGPGSAAATGNPEVSIQQAQELLNLKRSALTERIGQAKSAGEASRIGREGIALSPQEKEAYRAYQVAKWGRVLVEPEDSLRATEDEMKAIRARAVDEQVAQLQEQAGEGPMAQADTALKAALLQAAAARLDGTVADIANANRAVKDAFRGVRDALSDSLSAAAELASAVADAAGETVKVAEIAAAEAIRKRSEAPAGSEQSVIDRLDAAVVAANARLRDTDLGEQQRKLDVALQLEKISVAQAIQQLTALLAFPEITQKQTDDLLLKIKALRDQAAGDFKLSLGEIRLPTLYEVRRQAQSVESGVGYQDNRNVQVTMYVTNGMTEQRAQQFLSDAMGAPVRVVAPRPRAY